jgi:glyoxylase-like metal-dependent hydrolase (beta-lactamase superfamily II)
MKIGKYTLHNVNCGFFALDGGAMFGIIPKPLWVRTNPADEKNRIKMAARSLLLISDTKKILIDTGMGNDWNEKLREIYEIDFSENSVDKSLNKLNLKTSDITDVILTHLHFDHTGGSLFRIGNKYVPRFPNAKYYVRKRNFDWACNPSPKDIGSYIKEKFYPLFEQGMINFLENEDHFDDEIEFIIVNGHTYGQQLVKISDSSNTVLFSGDLFPTSSHVRLPYIMGYDIEPLETVKEKKQVLEKAVEENWKLFFEHDPFYALGTAKRTEKDFVIDEKFESL